MRALCRHRLTVFIMNQKPRAFTMIEIIAVIVVAGILGTAAISYFTSIRSESDALAAAPILSSIQLDLRRVSYDGVVPLDLEDALTLSGTAITAGTSTGLSEVSVARFDQTTAVYATLSGNRCNVLVDRLNGKEGWGVITDQSIACSATAALYYVPQITGSRGAPTEIS